jgi:hypothetical protein
MPNFYVTFGQQYRHEPHPVSKNIHPDGYVKIDALTLSEARDKAFEMLGYKWSFIYEEKEFKFEYFPKGEITL